MPVGMATTPIPTKDIIEANTLPPTVIGITSPYPTVAKETVAHHTEAVMLENTSGWASFSKKYIAEAEKRMVKTERNNVNFNSFLTDQLPQFLDGMNSNSNTTIGLGIEKINQGMKDISEGIWAKEATWLSFDDAEVSLLSSAEQVVSPYAYVLFYVRRCARTSNIIPDILDSSLDSILTID